MPLEEATNTSWAVALALVTATIAVASLVVTYFSNRSNRRSSEEQSERNRTHAAQEADRSRRSAADEAEENRQHAAIEADKNRRNAVDEAQAARVFARRADVYNEALSAIADTLTGLTYATYHPVDGRETYQKQILKMMSATPRLNLFGSPKSMEVWGRFATLVSPSAQLVGRESDEQATARIRKAGELHTEFIRVVREDLLVNY